MMCRPIKTRSDLILKFIYIMFKTLLLLVAILCIASAYNETNHVLKLGVDDFAAATQEFDNMLVKFYAPWCGHCKNLAPEYEKAAEILNKAQSKHRLAEVDCTTQKDVCVKYQVRGYPTLKLFSKGKEPIPYGSKRTANDIVEWINKETGSAELVIVPETVGDGQYKIADSVLVLEDSNLEQAIGEFNNILIKFFAPWCGHCKNLAPIYIEVAKALEAEKSDIKIAEVDCTVHKTACGKYGIRGYPTVMFFTQNNEPIKYGSAREKDTMISWLKENAVKEVGAEGEKAPDAPEEKIEQL